MDIVGGDLLQDAAYIEEAYTKGVDAIFETGRRLIEVREKYINDKGKWCQLIGANQWKGQGVLHIGKTQVYRLIGVASDPRLFPHAGILPPDGTTVYQLSRLDDDRLQELFDDGTINPGMARKDAAAINRQEMKARDEDRVRSLAPRQGKHRTLVIDPPWDYEWLSLAGRAAPGYATMTHDDLMDLDISQWAEDNCHMYLWVTNNFMTRGCELMAKWGFQHKTVLTWVKPRIGLGSYFRNSTEHVLFGVKGELRTRSDSISTHFEAPLGEHSEKPEIFYDIVREASYEPYGEAFQRTDRPDFINVFEEVDVAVSL